MSVDQDPDFDEDLVDDALARLAQDVPRHPLPPPPDATELAGLTHLNTSERKPFRTRGVLIGSVLVLGSAQAVAATGALERVRTWWVSIRVGSETVTAPVDGSRSFEFTSDDGYRVRVHIEGDVNSSRIEVRQDLMDAPFRIEEEVDVVRIGPPPGADQDLDSAILQQSPPLHEWRDRSDALHGLHIVSSGGLATLVRSYRSGEGETTASLVHRFDREIGGDAIVEIHEQTGGRVAMSVRDGKGWEIKLQIPRTLTDSRDDAAGIPEPQSWRSGSGRVRIDLDPSLGEKGPQ